MGPDLVATPFGDSDSAGVLINLFNLSNQREGSGYWIFIVL